MACEMEPEENNQSSKLDVRCSNSCTRAGLAVLLFSTLAFAMLGPLETAKQLEALGKYFTLRIELKDALDLLDGELCWKDLVDAEGDRVSNWTLAKLMEIECPSAPLSKKETHDPPEPQSHRQENSGTQPRTDKKQDKSAPAPPRMLRIVSTLWEFEQIANALAELGNDETMSLARSYSYRFDRSIYRWEMLRHRILSRIREAQPVSGPPSKSSVKPPNASREEEIKYLTFEDIRRLASYEQPELSEIEPHFKELSRFNLPSFGIPLGLITATKIVESGLLFLLAYFWLFQREAKLSKNYPATGTLFGVFRRTFISRNMFKVFMTLPSVAAVLLGIKSIGYTYWNIVLAIFVFGFCIAIAWNWEHR
jgi:hypothetical protein